MRLQMLLERSDGSGDLRDVSHGPLCPSYFGSA